VTVAAGATTASFTVSAAVLVVPAYAALIVTAVDALTALVLTVKLAVVAPAATVALAGTRAAVVLLLESETTAPPDGAAPLNVTVPVEDCVPPVTLVGFSVNEDNVTGGGVAGFTVSVAVLVVPPNAALIVTAVEALTALVLTVKLAVVAPAATVTLAGTRAAVVLLLESETTAPPEGAAPLNVTVPVEDCVPPVTAVRIQRQCGRVTAADAAGARSNSTPLDLDRSTAPQQISSETRHTRQRSHRLRCQVHCSSSVRRRRTHRVRRSE